MEPEPDSAPRGAGVGDAEIARALAAGDPAGLERAYRRYADPLHAYCRSVLHDAESAADAVHDTFVVASQRAGELRDPSRLRPWLYAVARNECLRMLRGRRRQAPLDEAAAVSAEAVDLGAGLRAEEIRELVHTASAGLTEGDRQVIELALRHDLSAADVGAVLGVPANHVHARLSRARGQLERALGALLVARTGAADCDELQSLLGGWDGQLTGLLRKRLSRHIDGCDICGERRRRQLQPSALLSGYAALPFALVGEELWTRLRLTCGDAGAARSAGAREIAARAGRFDRASGFPLPLDRRRAVVGWRVAAAAGLILVIGALALMAPRSGALVWHAPAASGVPTGAASSPAPGPAEAGSETPTPPVSPAGPAPSGDLPSPGTSASPSTDPPSPYLLTVTPRATARCPSGGWLLYVTAEVGGGEPDAVTLHWLRSDGTPGSAPMSHDGKTWTADTGMLSPRHTIQWWVTATAPDGGSGQSERRPASTEDCPSID